MRLAAALEAPQHSTRLEVLAGKLSMARVTSSKPLSSLALSSTARPALPLKMIHYITLQVRLITYFSVILILL